MQIYRSITFALLASTCTCNLRFEDGLLKIINLKSTFMRLKISSPAQESNRKQQSEQETESRLNKIGYLEHINTATVFKFSSELNISLITTTNLHDINTYINTNIHTYIQNTYNLIYMFHCLQERQRRQESEDEYRWRLNKVVESPQQHCNCK